MRFGYLVGLMVLWSTSLAQAAPVIKVDEAVWNVGIIISGKTYEKVVVVENAGNEPLIIDKVEECCGFFGTLPAGLRLLPGEKAELKLSLAPFKMVGTLRAEIFLLSNDPAQPRFAVLALGEVVPAVHALGEVVSHEVALGRIGMRDRVPFTVRLRSAGNAPLEILRVDKTDTVIEKGSRPVIAPGTEGDLHFEFVPRQSGNIDERLTIVTNDSLERSLEVQLQGQVLSEYVAEQAISIYPPGGVVPYNVTEKSYRFDFTVSNRGPMQIEIPAIESSIQGARIDVPRIVAPGEAVKGSVTFANGPAAAPNSGWIYLQLAIPVELR